MNVRISKRITYRIKTTVENKAGLRFVETRLFNFSSEPTDQRLRYSAKSLVPTDIIGMRYISHESERID